MALKCYRNDEKVSPPRARPPLPPPNMAFLVGHRKAKTALVHVSKSHDELSMPNLFEGAKEVSLPLLRDL
jgi:hypothetical protein